MWLGPKGAITPLHIDGLDNISLQLAGKKEWILVNPIFYDQIDMFAPFAEAPNLHVSKLDLRGGGMMESQIPFVVIEVNAGEGLYLPAG